MLSALLQKIKHIMVTLRFSILVIFITFFVSTILLLIGISYYRASNVALYIANNLMVEMSKSAIDDVRKEIMWVSDGDKLTAQLIQNNIIPINNIPLFLKYVTSIIKHFDLVQAVLWGDEEGNFILIEEEPDGKISLHIINRKQSPGNIDYDPRVRSWYANAKAAKHSIWTDIYESLPSHRLALTTATPVFEKDNSLRGVIGFSIRLDYLSTYVSAHRVGKNGCSFIVNENGKLIAFSGFKETSIKNELIDIYTVNIPWVITSFDLYKKNKQATFDFDYEGKTYLAHYASFPHDVAQNWMVGIVVPEDDFTQELKKSSFFDAGLGLFILAVGILCVSSLVTRVVDPIKNLVKQTNKIKLFELDEKKRIRSRIKEVKLLSDAVYSLRLGLKSFQKYVPASLVRQLIEAGEDARIGGTKKEITIIFSDIKNFTSIAENMDPDVLMEYVCDYFDELSKIILMENGTIDKYIGDSVMAFWGAPLTADEPCQRAARVALHCLHRLKELNAHWQEQGKPPLITRFGVHTGDAIVGNVGSTERLNYTALGDAINVTSRLEKMNKIYDTQIIVSEVLFEKIKDRFVLRKIDRIAVKGKMVSGYIYELLAEHKHELPFDIDPYRQAFEKAFAKYQQQQWDEAILLFKNCLLIYPEDTVAPIFIKRCLTFKAQPPRNWDGVWRDNASIL